MSSPRSTFDVWLAALGRASLSPAVIHAFDALVGIPASDAEFREALESGLISAPEIVGGFNR